MALGALSAIGGLLANPKALIRMGLLTVAAILAFKIFGFVEDAVDARSKVIEQEVVIQLKDQEINTLNASIEQLEEAQQIASEDEAKILLLEEQLRAIRDAALRASEEDDGPIAPVLRDTLCALGPISLCAEG